MIEVFVDPVWADGPSPVVGGTALWNSTKESRRNVTYETDGFSTVAQAIAAVDAGGTVWLAAASIACPASITKSVVIRGLDATLTMTETIVVSNATVRFRDVTIDSTGSTLAAIVKAASGALVGLTHCTLNGPATVAALADGSGSGIVLNGCSLTGTITTTLSKTDGGAGATFARTEMPTGGPCGRAGNHYRHRLLIEAPAVYRPADKGQASVWVPVDEAYGSIEPLRASEYVTARLAAADATHKVEFPGGLTITPVFRVTWRGKSYYLGGSLATDTRENRMAFMALERTG